MYNLFYIFFTFFSLSLCLPQYNIKKKEEVVELAPPEPDNPLMRKKKTPEELAREAEEAELDDFTSKWRMFLFFYLFSSILSSYVSAFLLDFFDACRFLFCFSIFTPTLSCFLVITWLHVQETL